MGVWRILVCIAFNIVYVYLAVVNNLKRSHRKCHVLCYWVELFDL